MSPHLKLRANHIFVVAVILLLAATLRIWNIGRESFWADEGWSIILSKGPTLPDVVQTMAEDQHPPLYFALLHYWIDLTGNSEDNAAAFGVLVADRRGIGLPHRRGGVPGKRAYSGHPGGANAGAGR
jgi:hypothetical protein